MTTFKHKIIGLVITVIILPAIGYAATCNEITCPSSVSQSFSGANCKSSGSARCYKHTGSGRVIKITSCASCNSGSLQYVTADNICEVSFGTCPCAAQNWTNTSNNQEYRYACNCKTNHPCPSTREQRCKNGYYPVRYPFCDPCPTGPNGETVGSNQEVIKGSEYFGSDQIKQCYLKSNQKHIDTTGEFTYTSNCYYKQ